MDFFEQHGQKLAAFSRLSGVLGARADYVQGGGGNTSVKLDNRLMAIKASGFMLSDITPRQAYAVLDYEQLRRFYLEQDPRDLQDVEAMGSAEAKASTLGIEGLSALRPSVEAGFHSLLDGFVAHTHSVWGNLAACSGEAGAILQEVLKGANYGYALVPYVDPGARLTFEIRDALRRAQQKGERQPAVLLMQNHGPIVHHDDPDACLRIHEDMNLRIASHLGLRFEDFPQACIEQDGAEGWRSATPWLWELLCGNRYPDSLLLNEPLYPDQMVFFRNTLGEKMTIDRATGHVHYALPRQSAQTLEETLCAVLFIHETLARLNLPLVAMGQEAQQFISGWESEKYRKSLSEGSR